MELLAARPTAKLHMIPKRTTGRRRDTGIGTDGNDAQNTMLEVQHNFKEIASRRPFNIILRKWQVEELHNPNI